MRPGLSLLSSRMTIRRLLNPLSVVLYVFLYTVYDIAIVVSSQGNTSFAFHPIVVIMSAEILKLLFSVIGVAVEKFVHGDGAVLVVPSRASPTFQLWLSIREKWIFQSHPMGSSKRRIYATTAGNNATTTVTATRTARDDCVRYEAVIARMIKQEEFESYGISLLGFQELLPGDKLMAVSHGGADLSSTCRKACFRCRTSCARPCSKAHSQATRRLPDVPAPFLHCESMSDPHVLDSLGILKHVEENQGKMGSRRSPTPRDSDSNTNHNRSPETKPLVLTFVRPLEKRVWIRTLGLFGVAALYTVWNVLNYEALLRVKLSQYSVVYQVCLCLCQFLCNMVWYLREGNVDSVFLHHPGFGCLVPLCMTG